MWRVDFGLITACLTRCRYYRCACIWLSNPTFWQRNLSSLKWDQITQSAGNCWTKIKLRSAANHAIYLVIFHWVVGSLYLNWYINFTTVGFLVCTEERSVSLYACKFDCFNWTKWGTFPMLSPWSSCKVGDPSSYVPRPPPVLQRSMPVLIGIIDRYCRYREYIGSDRQLRCLQAHYAGHHAHVGPTAMPSKIERYNPSLPALARWRPDISFSRHITF